MIKTTRKCPAPMRHGKESTVSPSQPSLPTNRVFVVQFRAPPTGASPSYDGRVEHVVSGQVIPFHSPEELLAFMISVLTDVQAP
jgi:hypothetical protein